MRWISVRNGSVRCPWAFPLYPATTVSQTPMERSHLTGWGAPACRARPPRAGATGGCGSCPGDGDPPTLSHEPLSARRTTPPNHLPDAPPARQVVALVGNRATLRSNRRVSQPPAPPQVVPAEGSPPRPPQQAPLPTAQPCDFVPPAVGKSAWDLSQNGLYGHRLCPPTHPKLN